MPALKAKEGISAYHWGLYQGIVPEQTRTAWRLVGGNDYEREDSELDGGLLRAKGEARLLPG